MELLTPKSLRQEVGVSLRNTGVLFSGRGESQQTPTTVELLECVK
jgi:hypothetical protein